MKSIKEIYPSFAAPKKIVITMHQKPDPDAMGSSLGLYHFLKQFGHTIQVISPTNWADFLKWMPGCENVLDFENPKDRERVDASLKSAEWVFCLDYNTLSRTRHMAGMLRSLKATKILIDHHQQPEVTEFQYGISSTAKSSTCEMVYDVIVESGHDDKINLEVAQCLYAGVMGDTGSFRFSSTTDSVHHMIASLKKKGLEHTLIHEAVYDNFLENRLRFIGHVLLNRLQVFYESNTAMISIPWKDLVKYDIKTGDTEGLVNYPLSIQGIKLAALIIDRNEEIKLSFRSKGNFDVNTFARKYFDGGGHFNAAGGRSTESLDATVQRFINAIKENQSLLQ
ncbi:MAG TPA: DHH family phosphoesterase [Chitinophagaceae bacterium]|nr:DHH family phosphoesterase [Chitinophagaceae bacterium]